MLTEFMNTLKEIPKKTCDSLLISEKLNAGETLVVASKVKQGFFKTQTQIKYVFRVELGKLCTYKLYGSTENQIRLSLMCLCSMEPGIFDNVVFPTLIGDKTAFVYECDSSYLAKAELRACIPNSNATLPMTPEVKAQIDEQFKEVKDEGVLFLDTP